MKKLVLMLTAAVIMAGVVTTNLWLNLRAEHAKAEALAARVAAAESARLSQTSMPPSPVMPVAAALNPQTVAAPAAIAVPPAPQQSAAEAGKTPMNAVLKAMITPEGQDATRIMMRGVMTQMYPDIEQELGLTPQEKQQLFDLLAMDGQESAALMLSGGQDPAATRELQRKLVEAQRAQEAKLAALLGSKYPKWEDYQSTVAARQQVDQLRRTLGASGNPLNDAQANQLVAAFAAEQRRSNKEIRAWSISAAAINSPNMMQESMQRSVATQGRLVDVAAPILDSAQLERYRRQVEQQASMLRATMGMLGAGGKP
jgi:hypothetical protein